MPKSNPKKAKEIKEFIEKWRNYWKDNNNTYDEWVQFVMGSQWLDDEARVFDNYQKTPMTHNKIAPLKNNLIGDQRQNTPSLQVVPDDAVPEETASIREALIKDITFSPEAKIAFQTAFDSAVVGGFGVWEIGSEYESDDSFNQYICIKAKRMPQRCFFDVSAITPCKTDGMGSGYVDRMSKKKAKALYGKDAVESCKNEIFLDGSETVINDDDSVSVITYYERKYIKEKLYQLSNNETVNEDEFKTLERAKIELDEQEESEIILYNGEVVTVVKERIVPRYKVMHYKFVGDYEVEKTEFPSKQLPLIFVDQDSFFDKTGRQITRPFFKDAYDAQRTINYIATQSCYLMKISRYDQFLVSKENVRSNDTAAIWRDPMHVLGALYYDESPTGAKPEQMQPAQLPPFLIQQYERALNDIASSTGMYQTQLGQQGNETSGVAVDARTKRGAYSTFTPFDSLNRAIACTGEIVNEMTPFIYDTERTVTVNLKDKGETKVTLNQSMGAYEGSPLQNDMTKGNYKVRLLPGPSWEGQKQENLDSMQQILAANPQLFNMIADLYVENLPLANSIELRNRLRTIVPPEVIEAGKTGQPLPPKPEQPDPQMIAAMAKMKELELKGAMLQQAQQKLNMEANEKSEEIRFKYMQLEAQKQEAAAELVEMQLRYDGELRKSQSDEEIAHQRNLVTLLTHESSNNHNQERM